MSRQPRVQYVYRRGPAAVPCPAEREPATEADLAAVAAQLGRPPRGTRAVAHRCPCGLPDVVETTPRLADGTPFPTLFYLTCPRATAACSRLESAGLMKEMAARLAADPELAARYRAAHEDYLARREAIGARAGDRRRLGRRHAGPGQVPARAPRPRAGRRPGVNPFGDETLALVEPWWTAGPCVDVPAGE